MQIEQRRLKILWLTRGYLHIIPPYDIGISPRFLSMEFSFDSHRSSYNDRKSNTSTYIFTKWYFEKKELTGALGGV